MIAMLIITTIITLLSIAFFTISERKLLASIQRRKGPDVTEFWGGCVKASRNGGWDFTTCKPSFISGCLVNLALTVGLSCWTCVLHSKLHHFISLDRSVISPITVLTGSFTSLGRSVILLITVLAGSFNIVEIAVSKVSKTTQWKA